MAQFEYRLTPNEADGTATFQVLKQPDEWRGKLYFQSSNGMEIRSACTPSIGPYTIYLRGTYNENDSDVKEFSLSLYPAVSQALQEFTEHLEKQEAEKECIGLDPLESVITMARIKADQLPGLTNNDVDQRVESERELMEAIPIDEGTMNPLPVSNVERFMNFKIRGGMSNVKSVVSEPAPDEALPERFYRFTPLTSEHEEQINKRIDEQNELRERTIAYAKRDIARLCLNGIGTNLMACINNLNELELSEATQYPELRSALFSALKLSKETGNE